MNNKVTLISKNGEVKEVIYNSYQDNYISVSDSNINGHMEGNKIIVNGSSYCYDSLTEKYIEEDNSKDLEGNRPFNLIPHTLIGKAIAAGSYSYLLWYAYQLLIKRF